MREVAGLWPCGLRTVKEKGVSEQDDKAERLAKALRDNLRRRKEQARELSGQQPKNDQTA